MKESDLSEFAIEEEGLKLRIKRGSAHTSVHTNSGVTMHAPIPSQQAAVSTTAPTPQITEDKNVHFVKSPMVGTFYKSSSPDNPPFVKVGDKVEKTTVVCILEAMKVMNEIHAETQGTVLEVLVENGQTIEYGQPLFKIKLG